MAYSGLNDDITEYYNLWQDFSGDEISVNETLRTESTGYLL